MANENRTKKTAVSTVYSTRYLANPELVTHTKFIAECFNGMNRNLFGISYSLYQIKSQELYKDDFKSLEEYGKELFGLKKSAIYNYANVGERFITPEGHSIFATQRGDFTITALVELLKVDDNDDIISALEQGIISYNSTVKDIIKFVKGLLVETDPETTIDGDSVEDEDASNQIENEEPEVKKGSTISYEVDGLVMSESEFLEYLKNHIGESVVVVAR